MVMVNIHKESFFSNDLLLISKLNLDPSFSSIIFQETNIYGPPDDLEIVLDL